MFTKKVIPLTLLGLVTAKSGPAKLTNPRFSDGNWWKAPGTFFSSLKPEYAIDGYKSTFAHDAKNQAGSSPFSVDIIGIHNEMGLVGESFLTKYRSPKNYLSGAILYKGP